MSRDTDQLAGGLLDAVARVHVDRDGRVRSVDRVAADLFDLDVVDAVGMALSDIVGDQWLGIGGPDAALQSLDTVGAWSGYATHRTRAGLMPVALTARRLTDRRTDDPGIILTVTADVDRVPRGWVGTVRADVAALLGSERFPALLSLVGWLLTAREPEDIGAAVCGTVMDSMGAVGGHLSLVGDEAVATFVTLVGYSQATRAQWPTVDLAVGTPVRRAIVEQAPVFLADRAARDEQFPVLRGVDEPTQALCAVPLVLSGRVFGTIGFSFADAREFTGEDRAFLSTVAHITTLALQHTDPAGRSHPAAAETGTDVSFTWESTPVELGALRDAIRLQAIAADLDPSDALLCACELVTNATEHGGFPVHARVTVTTGVIRIEVSDAGRRLPQMRTPGADGGFGLRIVESISDRWGTMPAPWGKTTWAELTH